MRNVMTIDWKEVDSTKWRKEYKELKASLTLNEINLLDNGATTIKESWKLGTMHAEYKKLISKLPPNLPTLNK